MHTARWVALVAALGMSATTATGADGEAAGQDAAARGAALLQPFKRDLKQALTSGLQQGPVAAVSVCKLEAPAIAAALSTDGVAMGRTSHRLRNPANAGPAWAESVLQGYLADDTDARPQVRSLDDGRTGYVEPIRMQAMCVTCHGATLAPELAARIEAEYPDDQATGFETGDLRGVFWVTFAMDEGEGHPHPRNSHEPETRHHRN